MRTNGTLKYLVKETDKLDEDGAPSKSIPVWSNPVPCMIKSNQQKSKGTYVDGEFTTASYEVLIEQSSFDAKRLILVRNGTNLGEFEVRDIEPIITMGRIKILL